MIFLFRFNIGLSCFFFFFDAGLNSYFSFPDCVIAASSGAPSVQNLADGNTYLRFMSLIH
jgi:hypothetical protein